MIVVKWITVVPGNCTDSCMSEYPLLWTAGDVHSIRYCGMLVMAITKEDALSQYAVLYPSGGDAMSLFSSLSTKTKTWYIPCVPPLENFSVWWHQGLWVLRGCKHCLVEACSSHCVASSPTGSYLHAQLKDNVHMSPKIETMTHINNGPSLPLTILRASETWLHRHPSPPHQDGQVKVMYHGLLCSLLLFSCLVCLL